MFMLVTFLYYLLLVVIGSNIDVFPNHHSLFMYLPFGNGDSSKMEHVGAPFEVEREFEFTKVHITKSTRQNVVIKIELNGIKQSYHYVRSTDHQNFMLLETLSTDPLKENKQICVPAMCYRRGTCATCKVPLRVPSDPKCYQNGLDSAGKTKLVPNQMYDGFDSEEKPIRVSFLDLILRGKVWINEISLAPATPIPEAQLCKDWGESTTRIKSKRAPHKSRPRPELTDDETFMRKFSADAVSLAESATMINCLRNQQNRQWLRDVLEPIIGEIDLQRMSTCTDFQSHTHIVQQLGKHYDDLAERILGQATKVTNTEQERKAFLEMANQVILEIARDTQEQQSASATSGSASTSTSKTVPPNYFDGYEGSSNRLNGDLVKYGSFGDNNIAYDGHLWSVFMYIDMILFLLLVITCACGLCLVGVIILYITTQRIKTKSSTHPPIFEEHQV